MGPATVEARPATPPAKEPARGREASHGVGAGEEEGGGAPGEERL
jgi:hypothetical protein